MARGLRAAERPRARLAFAALCASVLVALAAPARASAQSWGGEVAAASAVSGLEAGLGTWALAMPWEGFWHDTPQAGDGWAIACGLVAAAGTSVSSWAITRGHPERAELVALVSGAGLALSATVALLGGLYALVADYDRTAFSLVFGLPAVAASVLALIVGAVHLAVVGDAATAPPAPLVAAPLAVSF
jgi:hypothetical protein